MDLLGPSLWDAWNSQSIDMTPQYVACVAVEAIIILQALHEKGWVSLLTPVILPLLYALLPAEPPVMFPLPYVLCFQHKSSHIQQQSHACKVMHLHMCQVLSLFTRCLPALHPVYFVSWVSCTLCISYSIFTMSCVLLCTLVWQFVELKLACAGTYMEMSSQRTSCWGPLTLPEPTSCTV